MLFFIFRLSEKTVITNKLFGKAIYNKTPSLLVNYISSPFLKAINKILWNF